MAEIRLIHAEDSAGFARRIVQALAAEGHSIDDSPPGEARVRHPAASVVVWSPALFHCEAGLAEARAALAARRLAPVSLGRIEAPTSFEHLWPTDLTGWSGARDDPRWRFVLDEIALAMRRAENDGHVLLLDEITEEAGGTALPGPAGPMRALALAGAVALGLALVAMGALYAAPRLASALAPSPAPASVAAVSPASALAPSAGPELRDMELRDAALAPAETLAQANAQPAAPENPPETAPEDGAEEPLEILPQPDEVDAPLEPAPRLALNPRLPPAPADDFVGALVRDCVECPDMVEIPTGAFVMGARDDDPDAATAERPAHAVTIARAFALARRPVTFDDWDRCVEGGGCRAVRPDDAGWGRGARPVINVSREDAQAYIDWLSAVSGRAYRLPTEAEWEYAARAGADATNAAARALAPSLANFDGALRAEDDEDVVLRMTTPTGSYAPNVFGLYDMLGNVWEIVSSCWTPSHGWARSEEGCEARVAKGGSYADPAGSARASSRRRIGDDERRPDTGFRVARDAP